MIQRFEEPTGQSVEKIVGQDRFAFAHSDTSDFYDLIEWAEDGGYRGSTLQFFDFMTGRVYRPFPKKRNVLYSDPVYAAGFYYFLQGDYDAKKITLYRCFPETVLEKVTELSCEEVNLYNLRIIGDPIHIISQGDTFACYYPETLSFPIDGREVVLLIQDGKVYSESWVEEGWDEEKDRATDAYRYYDKVIVRDLRGTVLSEEVGSLYQAADGAWWIV